MDKKARAWYDGWAVTRKGGYGSGNFGHRGRLGKRGGSLPGGVSITSNRGRPVYHSTAPWFINQIKENGLQRGEEWAGRPPSVYYTDSMESSHFYGELFGGNTYAIVEFDVPERANVINDPEHPNAWRIEHSVPPENIRSVRVFIRGREVNIEDVPPHLLQQKARKGYAAIGLVLSEKEEEEMEQARIVQNE